MSHIFYSDDGGESWELGGTVGLHTNECQVVELSNGDLMINMRNYWQRDGGDASRGGMRAVSISKDARMDPLQSHKLKGNWAPVLLTHNKDESIDYIRLKEEIEILIGFGGNGIYTNGTSSEFYNQSEDEFDRISQITAECCDSAGVSFQLGVSHPSPWISLHRLKRSASLQPGAVQVVLPDWSVPNDEEMMNFLERIAEAAAPCGLVLYNPSFAKRVLQPHEWAAIKKRIPNFIGVKVAGGDEAWYASVREYAQGVAVFAPGHHLASAIQQGAQGAYSNVACLHPGAAQRWYELMLTDMDTALEWEARIQAFMSNHIAPFITEQRFSHQAADRLLALVGGWCELSHCLRWPYNSIADDEVKKCGPSLNKRCRSFLNRDTALKKRGALVVFFFIVHS